MLLAKTIICLHCQATNNDHHRRLILTPRKVVHLPPQMLLMVHTVHLVLQSVGRGIPFPIKVTDYANKWEILPKRRSMDNFVRLHAWNYPKVTRIGCLRAYIRCHILRLIDSHGAWICKKIPPTFKDHLTMESFVAFWNPFPLMVWAAWQSEGKMMKPCNWHYNSHGQVVPLRQNPYRGILPKTDLMTRWRWSRKWRWKYACGSQETNFGWQKYKSSPKNQLNNRIGHPHALPGVLRRSHQLRLLFRTGFAAWAFECALPHLSSLKSLTSWNN